MFSKRKISSQKTWGSTYVFQVVIHHLWMLLIWTGRGFSFDVFEHPKNTEQWNLRKQSPTVEVIYIEKIERCKCIFLKKNKLLGLWRLSFLNFPTGDTC